MRSRLVHQLRGQLCALSGAGTFCPGRCDRPMLGRYVLVLAESTRYLLAPWWSLVLALTARAANRWTSRRDSRGDRNASQGAPIGIDVVPRYITVEFCCRGFEAEGRRDERVLFGQPERSGGQVSCEPHFVCPIQFRSFAQ